MSSSRSNAAILWWTALSFAGGAAAIASINSVRFRGRVAREARELMTAAAEPPILDRQKLRALPPVVAQYFDKAIGVRAQPIRTARLRHRGRFRPSLNGRWLPIRGEQYFRTDQPAFLWWGRVRMLPGLWIDARDRSVSGRGNMFVSAESTFTLANSSGPQLDQGAALRLLGEMMWLPTALLDDRYVRWSSIDDRRARASLTVGGLDVAGVFEFGDDGLPVSFGADRYRDVGGGAAVLTPFVGRSSDFRSVDGMMVPFRMLGSWIVDGSDAEYADFRLEEIAFDRGAPF